MQKNFDSKNENSEQTIFREGIVAMLQEAKDRDSPAILSPKSIGVSFFCTILNVTSTFVVLKNPIPPELARQVLQSTEFGLYCGTYWLSSAHIYAHGTDIKIPLPETAAFGQSRNAQRRYFGAKEDARSEIQHPFDPTCILSRKVFDTSPGGFSFRALHKSAFLQPGRILPMITLYLGHEVHSSHSGKIIYIKQIIDLNGRNYNQVGVQFIELDNDSQDDADFQKSEGETYV